MSSISWKRNIKGTYGIAYVDIGIINDISILKREIISQLSKLEDAYPGAKQTNFDINVPASHDGTMFNHAFVYFSNWEVFNAFIGLNFDGTPRKRYNLGGKISLEKLDPKDLEGFPQEEFNDSSKKIGSALNKVTESSFENLKDIFLFEAVKHTKCIKFIIERVFFEIQDIKPDLSVYELKTRVFVAIIDKLKQENKHEIFLKVMYHTLLEHELNYNLFAFACLFIQRGLVNVENFKDLIAGLDETTAFDFFTKAVKFTKGDLWKKCGKQLKEEFERFSQNRKDLGNRINFAIDDLKKIMKEPIEDDSEEDWMRESEVEDLEPLVKFNYFLLPAKDQKIMKDNYEEFVRTAEVDRCPEDTVFLAGFTFQASSLRPLDKTISCHNKLVGRNFPDWVTKEKVSNVFSKYSTSDEYPRIEIDNNKMACYVIFSPEQAHFQDAGFAQQMCKFVKFESGGKSETVKFDFMREFKSVQKVEDNRKPRLARAPFRRR